MPDFRPVSTILGIFVALLGALMLIPGAVDLYAGEDDWGVFFAAAGVSIFFGVGLWASGRGHETELNVRQTFLLTSLSWVVLACFGALPFIWSGLSLSASGAFFEAMSGLTTTGSTAISGLDQAPRGILMWRAILHFYGGIGIIVVAIAILPTLRVGGMQLLRAESSDRSEKVFPAAKQIAGSIFGVYVALNIACAAAYSAAGLPLFQAVTLAMSTVATGGFAPSDTSLIHLGATVQWISIVFMISGALPFVLYIHAARGRPGRFIQSTEVKLFATIIAAMTLLAWINLVARGISVGEPALRAALFNITTVITTTGLVAFDYTNWGPFNDILLIIVAFVGGCTGSTSGGIKPLRLLIIAKTVVQQIRGMVYPNGVFPLTLEGRPLSGDVVRSVTTFVVAYFSVFVLLLVAASATGLDFQTAFSATAANLSNAGVGIGPVVGPVGNFSTINEPALWIMSAAMLLGRLEIFTILVLFSRHFWRQ